MTLASLMQFVQTSTLDLSDYLRRLGEKLYTSKIKSENGSGVPYDGELQHRQAEAQAADSLSWYRSKLRKTPYWSRGHIRVCELCLALNDLPAAYGAARAVLLLESSGPLNLKAFHLLGKIYLRTRSFEEARETLLKLHDRCPSDSSIKEDLAAAYLGSGMLADAHRLLSSISTDNLSQEGAAALQYLKQKMT